MSGKFIIKLFGKYTLMADNNKPMRFETENKAHEIMEANFPLLTDYQVIKEVG